MLYFAISGATDQINSETNINKISMEAARSSRKIKAACVGIKQRMAEARVLVHDKAFTGKTLKLSAT